MKLKDTQTEIKLPTGTVTIGPGTVPISSASIATTSIKDMITEFRKASRLGIFDDKEEMKPLSGTK
ncbi:MAG TPA: hypothetical protein VLG12_05595 [Candidatus Saccharimonadales bacterium]|nr:hypothetical protein [Candidatus Saccharimonadales bacterium]